METLTLNDGTVLNGYCTPSGNILWVYLYNTSMAEAYPILSDASKIGRIEWNQYGDVHVYTGYTHLFCIREEGGGLVSAGLIPA